MSDKNVSTLSWGILYDSPIYIVNSSACFSMFQPSLEEFFMILRYCSQFSESRIVSKFQPSLEEFFMILKRTLRRVRRNANSRFNPLLRNSLWFNNWWIIWWEWRWNVVSTLSWGILYDSVCRICGWKHKIKVSTLSWGILYDSS